MSDLTGEFLARRKDEARHQYDLSLGAMHGAASALVDAGADIERLRSYVEACDRTQRAWSDATAAYVRWVRGDRELFEAIQ